MTSDEIVILPGISYAPSSSPAKMPPATAPTNPGAIIFAAPVATGSGVPEADVTTGGVTIGPPEEAGGTTVGVAEVKVAL